MGFDGVIRESMRVEKVKKRKEIIKEKIKGKKLYEEDEEESEIESVVEDELIIVRISMIWMWVLKGEVFFLSVIVFWCDFVSY